VTNAQSYNINENIMFSVKCIMFNVYLWRQKFSFQTYMVEKPRRRQPAPENGVD